MKRALAIAALILFSAIDARTQCVGTSIAQIPIDVTKSMTFAAPGVVVDQLTTVGTNRFYYFDVPALARSHVAYVNFSGGNEPVLANLNGTKAEQLTASKINSSLFVSGDQQLAYYLKPVKGGAVGGQDIYGVRLFTSGKCTEFRISTLDMRAIAPLPIEEISSTSAGPNGSSDIFFSPDTLLHGARVFSNSTAATLPTYILKDPEGAGTFHRIRGNPKFNNIVMWKRNHVAGTSAYPEVWIVDLNTCENSICTMAQIVNIVAKVTVPNAKDVPEGGHIAWSPDGLTIAFSEPDKADYWLARNVVNANGTLNAAFTLQEIGPFVKPQVTADYCAFPIDWPTSTLMACLAGPASKAATKQLYLLSTDGKGTMSVLSSTDAQVLTINGTPMMQFLDDTHIIFNSDKTGVPQLYEVSNFIYKVQ